MRLIVGLGNPGIRYKGTRHNIGFMAVDYIAEANDIRFSKENFKSQLASASIHDREVILAKPMTFMNLSGVAVRSLSDYFHIEPKDTLVIYDDVDLDFGVLRIRGSGGSGGHRGMQSIIENLGTKDFPRIRLGIGRPKDSRQDVADYVLSNFRPDEKDVLKHMMGTAKEAVEAILKDGVEKAMNRFNKSSRD